jgi:CBS domain-containing protein
MGALQVRDLMTRGVFALLPEDELTVARKLMAGWRVRHAPVVDECGCVLGVVSQRDLLRASLLGRDGATEEEVAASLRARRAADVMSTYVELASPEEPAGEAARRMLGGKLGCLLVVDAHLRLCGILTESDFVRHVAEELPPPVVRAEVLVANER